MRTLNELSHLKDTGFGQPYPRHGLSLLWWFANKCVDIDQNGRMFALYNPKKGHFGFHEFHNEEDLLPDTDLTYYEVGNLSNLSNHHHHHHHPDTFPPIVTQNYDSDDPDSNTDRIIVSVDSFRKKVWFEQIYVTEHSDEDGFDESCTYRISQGLMRIIHNLERSDFISEVIIRRRRRNRR